MVKFQRVNCLTIFVESNQGDEDTTLIQKLTLLGSSGSRWGGGLRGRAMGGAAAPCEKYGLLIPLPRHPPIHFVRTGDTFNVAEIKDISKEDK